MVLPTKLGCCNWQQNNLEISINYILDKLHNWTYLTLLFCIWSVCYWTDLSPSAQLWLISPFNMQFYIINSNGIFVSLFLDYYAFYSSLSFVDVLSDLLICVQYRIDNIWPRWIGAISLNDIPKYVTKTMSGISNASDLCMDSEIFYDHQYNIAKILHGKIYGEYSCGGACQIWRLY